MADIENQIFTRVASEVRSRHSGTTVQSVDVYAPAKFPFVGLHEADSASLMRTRDTASNNNHFTVVYEANIYSNKMNGKKTEAKELEAIVDEVMDLLGFTKMSRNPMSSNDGTIYRIVSRYSAVIDPKSEVIYRR